MDVTASLFLADGRECKVITGIDDHSRFCVIATVVMRATARAVCLAFTAAMAEYGIPAEVLTDNGKQFTGRFGKPRPAEVLFERICRENGITQRLTKPRSPTTTGKIERLHQTLQLELLNAHGPFASVEDAQDAVDAWRKDYNTRRPHQSLDMAFPAARFTAAAGDAIGLRIPAELTRSPQLPVSDRSPEPDDGAAAPPALELGERQREGQGRGAGPGGPAVGEPLDRRSAGLARPGDDRAHRPALGRAQPGPRPARRPPHQDPAVPARRPRPGPPDGSRSPARRAAAAASGGRGRHRGRPDRERLRQRQPRRPRRQRRAAAGRAAGHRCGWTDLSPMSWPAASWSAPSPAPSRPRPGPGCAEPVPGPPSRPACPSPWSSPGGCRSAGRSWSAGRRSRSAWPTPARPSRSRRTGTYQIAVEPGITVTAARTTSRDIRRHKASNYG